MREYRDLECEILRHGDIIVTIELNGKAIGGDLKMAYFKIVDDKGMIVEDMNDNSSGWHFYKTVKSSKVLKK